MIKVTQVKSVIGQTKKQKDTLRALGLRGIGKNVEIDENNPQLFGMVKKVLHLVSVEEV